MRQVESLIRIILPKRELNLEFDGKKYSFKGKGTQEELEAWFQEYVKTAPRCGSCEELLLPGTLVAQGSLIADSSQTIRYFHEECVGTGGATVGYIGDAGELVLIDWNKTAKKY